MWRQVYHRGRYIQESNDNARKKNLHPLGWYRSEALKRSEDGVVLSIAANGIEQSVRFTSRRQGKYTRECASGYMPLHPIIPYDQRQDTQD